MPLGRCVEEEVIGLPVGLERSKMGSVPAKRSGEVVQESPGRGDGHRKVGDPESIKRVNLEMGEEKLRGRHRVEEVGFDLLRSGKTEGEITEQRLLPLWNEDLGGGRADHLVEQGIGRCEFGHAELARAQIGAGKPVDTPLLGRREDGGREVVALLLQARILQGSRTQDPGDLAADQLACLDLPDLLAERDAPAGGKELLHVAARRVVGNPAHRDLTALGQGDVQDRRGLLGVVEEHLVEIAEPEEQEGARRQVTPKGVILLHHRGRFGSHERRGEMLKRLESEKVKRNHEIVRLMEKVFSTF